MGSTGNSANKSDSVRTVTMPDGTNIELDDDLEYGRDTGRGNMPKTVVDFENKRRKAKVEHIMLTDADGNVLEERKGGKNSVRSSFRANSQATVVTHNHPRSGYEAGSLGGTFSVEDLDSFVLYRQKKTLRAVAGEGTYSITKVDGQFSRAMVGAFSAYGKQVYNELKGITQSAYDTYKTKSDNAYNDFRNDRITRQQMDTISSTAYREYEKKTKEVFNKELVRKHQWLIDNQKKYGYTYALER